MAAATKGRGLVVSTPAEDLFLFFSKNYQKWHEPNKTQTMFIPLRVDLNYMKFFLSINHSKFLTSFLIFIDTRDIVNRIKV